jgi:hypothetical protein
VDVVGSAIERVHNPYRWCIRGRSCFFWGFPNGFFFPEEYVIWECTEK